jgi:dTDP-4-amino-4,6-dideoxygalactose transaminase
MNNFFQWPIGTIDEIARVVGVLRSGKINYWTGPETQKFEKEFANFIGTKYAVALANGTVALEAALYAFDIGKGDEVIVTPRSFIASASSVVLCGAKPIFAETITKVISSRTKAIIVVHLAGWPCDMDPIMRLARKHRLYVIEDCAQAHGAEYNGRKVGSIGHIGAFSFCQDKIITTGGEGGMITTNNKKWWSKIWSFKDHGKSYDAVYKTQHKKGFRWLHESFGTNWRMTEMQAAIGRIQLTKLPQWLKIRRRNAAILTKVFQDIPVFRLTIPPQHIKHAYYKYYVFLRPEMLKTGWNRERIIKVLNNRGVPCYFGSCSEIYLEKAFIKAKLQPKRFLPVARELGNTSLMFLVHPTLRKNDMHKMAAIVAKVMKKAIK